MTQKEYLAYQDENENVWIIQKYGQNLEVRIKDKDVYAVRINHDWHNEWVMPIELVDWIHRRGL